jgi:hypothetical protein
MIKKMVAIFIMINTLIMGCASKLESPDEVTFMHIRKYKFNMDMGCKDAGINSGELQEKVSMQCSCIIDNLEKDLTKKDGYMRFFLVKAGTFLKGGKS